MFKLSRRAGSGARLLATVLLLGCQRPSRVAQTAGPELLDAAGGSADEVVRRAQHEAVRDGRQLLVYISASWCEPCERFQKAIRSGQLNAYFPRLRLLKFDQDRDTERLRVAGYDGQYIPRFVIPGPDGRGTTHRIEGGTKAEDTVMTSIGPRLQRMLNGQGP